MVVPDRVGHVEQLGAGDHVGADRALVVAGRLARRDGGREDRRPERRRHGEREAAVGARGAGDDRAGGAVVGVGRGDHHPTARDGGAGDLGARRRHRRAGGRGGDGQGGQARGWAVDVPRAHRARLLDRATCAERERQPGQLGLRPRQGTGRTSRVARRETDRGGGRVCAVRRSWHGRVLPDLLGHQAHPGRGAVHRVQQRRRAGGVAGLQLLLGALTGQDRPEVPGARVGRRPRLTLDRTIRRVRDMAVAVAVLTAGRRSAVAVPARAGRGRPLQRGVQDRQAGLHVGIVRRQDAEPGQLLEAAVDDRAFVGGWPAVAQAVRRPGVRVAGLGQPQEVARGVRPGGGHRPALDRTLEVVGGGEVELRPIRIALLAGNPAGRDQTGDLGGDGGRRVAALLLPPLGAERRPVRDHEVRGLAHVVAVERDVTAEPGLQGHQDRISRLVELVTPGVGRPLAVEQAVAGQPAVGELLPLEQETSRGLRGGEVPGGQQRRERLVEVAAEHLAVGPEVRRLAALQRAGRDRLPPRRSEPRHDRAGERLVLTGLHDVDAQVVGRPQPRDPLG